MKTVLLPVKDFTQAKGRLASSLDSHQRAGLARAMLADVLLAVSKARLPHRVVVYTASKAVAELVRAYDFDIIEEAFVQGHSAAVNLMVHELAPTSSHILSLAADLPNITPSEIDLVLESAVSELGFVSSRDGTGTNAALFVSPAHIDMAYGEGSLRRHLSSAAAAGYKAALLRVPGMEFDVDTPEDLAFFRQGSPCDSFTWNYLLGLPR